MSPFFLIHTQKKTLFESEENALRQNAVRQRLRKYETDVACVTSWRVCPQMNTSAQNLHLGPFMNDVTCRLRPLRLEPLTPPCCVTGEVFSSPQRGGRAFIDFINWVIFFIYCRNFDKMLCNTFNGCLTRDVCNWDVLTFADKHTRWWCHRAATTLRQKLDGGTDKEGVELLFLASSLENKVMFTFWDGEKSFF